MRMPSRLIRHGAASQLCPPPACARDCQHNWNFSADVRTCAEHSRSAQVSTHRPGRTVAHARLPCGNCRCCAAGSDAHVPSVAADSELKLFCSALGSSSSCSDQDPALVDERVDETERSVCAPPVPSALAISRRSRQPHGRPRRPHTPHPPPSSARAQRPPSTCTMRHMRA